MNLLQNTDAFAALFDHTLLSAGATSDEIRAACTIGVEKRVAAICINPWWVDIAAAILKGTGVKVCTVVGFPLGMTKIKTAEANLAVLQGAQEIDMVMAIGEFKQKNYARVKHDIKSVCSASSCVKVIIETSLLDEHEIGVAAKICCDAGAQYVKTSTGFGSRGASVNDIKIISQAVGGQIKIKASGGISTVELALDLIGQGACRIGASKTVQIIDRFDQLKSGQEK